MNNILPEGHFEGWKEFKHLPDGRYMECGYNTRNHHRLANCILIGLRICSKKEE